MQYTGSNGINNSYTIENTKYMAVECASRSLEIEFNLQNKNYF